jgi:hypothetical protein
MIGVIARLDQAIQSDQRRFFAPFQRGGGGGRAAPVIRTGPTGSGLWPARW